MRAWMAVGILGVGIVTGPAWSQMRPSVPGSVATGPSGAPVAAHIATSRAPGIPFGPRGAFGPGFHGRFAARGFQFHHHRPGVIIGAPYFYPGYYPSYPLFWDSYESDNSSENQQNYQLQQQVNQLDYELQRMRDEQEARSVAPPAAPVSPAPAQQLAPQSRTKEAPAPTTTIVFRDGKTQQLENYAIVGSTVWVFNEQTARKIPLSDLDLVATEKVNEDKGMPFQVPKGAQ